MVEAVMKHGMIKGTIMGGARIIRCSRWFLGGSDPVPDQWSFKAIKDEFTRHRRRS